MSPDEIRYTVLESIKRDCLENDNCSKCPFYIDFLVHKSCVFSGPHVSDGVVPADWDLEQLSPVDVLRDEITDETFKHLLDNN